MLDTKDRMAIHLKRLHKPRSCCRLMECASILGIPFEVRFRSKDDLCRVFSSLVKVLSPRSIVGLWDVGRIIGRRFKRGRMIRPDAPPTVVLLVEIQPLRAVRQYRAPTRNKFQILGNQRLMVGIANGCSFRPERVETSKHFNEWSCSEWMELGTRDDGGERGTSCKR